MRVDLPGELADKLRALAAKEQASLFATVLAAFNVLVARYTNQTDVSIMIPVGCRQRFQTEDVIGYFSNMLVLRTPVAEDADFRSLIAVVKKEVLNGLARQDIPFEKVVEAVKPDRSLSHDPLASIALSFLSAEGTVFDLPGVEATYEELPNGGSKFDVHLTVSEQPNRLSCLVEYNADVFDGPTVARLLEHLRGLLAAAAADPTQNVYALPILADAERREIIETWNATAKPVSGKTVLDLIASSDATAVSMGDEKITYRELLAKSRRIARCLVTRGVGPGVLVGIAVDRSIGMVAALIGILAVGAAYVPLDPSYPRDRLAHMAEDSGLHVLVTERKYAELLDHPAGGLLLLDGDAAEIERASDAALDHRPLPEGRAYVIYTSGSTGKPKGVAVPHRALTNFLLSMAAAPGVAASDVLLAVTSLSFDIAGLELWLPLAIGARIELASRETAADGTALRRILDAGAITVMQATPTTFRLLIEAGWTGDKKLKVLVGGEAVPAELVDRLLDRVAQVWNMYGPTETTIWSAIERLEKNAPVLIGRPIDNTQIYVLDRRRAPVPVGVFGEIWIAGEGLAEGYLGQPALTAERFVPDPFAPGARMYRTGDLGRHRPGGALEFGGRVDSQIKFRGYRIELGEIEAILSAHPGVREGVVIVRKDGPEESIVAYVTAHGATAPEAADLRVHLRAKLPEYMIPARFVALEQLPLTANNKIDRKALPAPPKNLADAKNDDDAPREPAEVKLREIWQELLGIEGIGRHDSFFDLGGHSLLVLKLFDRIERTLDVALPVTALLSAPTIAQLAELMRNEGYQPSWNSLVPIQGSSAPTAPAPAPAPKPTNGAKHARMPFFCVHAIGGNVLNYRLLSRYLGEEQPFFGLQSRGLDGKGSPPESIEEMARLYIEEIRCVQPHGPYSIGGSSSGGVVAFEMAQQLCAAGEEVGVLVLMDTVRVGMPRRLESEHVISPLHGIGLALDLHLGNLLLRSPREGLDYLMSRVRARIKNTASPFERMMDEAPPAVKHVWESNLRAILKYKPKAYGGKACLLLTRSDHRRVFYDERLAWADLVEGGLTVRFVPGTHESFLDEPHIQGVADQLSRCLAQPL
jgi:amino acid adenylation domain-containing protein